jgi:asparagine synthase (glutamine-hydrolysing)
MLGVSRLAILDLTEAGMQPMTFNGQVALAMNGEIYNYVELRSELAALGHVFDSTGDAEVLLKAYLEWGIEALSRLEGMWAFALYDERRHGLLLSRDRFGEKPLFWTRWRGGIAFASEVKQLLCYADVNADVDSSRAAAYLVTGRPYDGNSTWFRNIEQVEPGGWLWTDDDGQTQGTYYDLEAAVANVPGANSPEDWAARFGEAFSRSIRLRLRSDVPVGTSLSAGIDSSAILSEAVAQGHQRYSAFTAGSDSPDLDESDEAARFARSMGSAWHGVTADPHEFAALWDRMTWHHEAPVPSTSLYGQWKVFETARAAGVVVILDGQGADEVLGGYHHFLAAQVLKSLGSSPRRTWNLIMAFARQVGGATPFWTAGYRYLGALSGAPRPERWLRPGLYAGDRNPPLRGDSRSIRVADIRRWSLPNLLAYADRNSMAHGVETRLPYLDPEIVALALAMPDDVLVHDGWTKWPLRVALARRAGPVPTWVRGKRGFGIPQGAWLRPVLDPFVRAWLDTPHPAWDTVLDRTPLREFQDRWVEGPRKFSWDDHVFKMVALDRFFHVWSPI